MVYSEKIVCSDEELRWENQSGSSTPRSGSSSSSTQSSVFSTPGAPESPTGTEVSVPSLGPNDKKLAYPNETDVNIIPSFANHILVGHEAFTPGRISAMRDVLLQARSTGEFPSASKAPEDAQTIVEDYQHLQRLRDARGNPSIHPPPELYSLVKIDIARRIKAREEAQGGSDHLQEMDNRVQTWMNSINKEARMLEITQAALQRKGISNPTQDDLDAIAEEFMQIAERTLLDVANPLRMNASRMEGNISRMEGKISRFDSQLNGLSSLDGAMTTQLDTLNTVLTNLHANMGTNINTLNAILTAQTTGFNGSVNMLNTALSTVQADLYQLTNSLPSIIAAAVQTAVQEQLSSTPYHTTRQHRQATGDAPPSYKHMAQAAKPYLPAEGTTCPVYVNTPFHASHVFAQQHKEVSQVASTQESKSRLGKFWKKVTGNWGSNKEKELKINVAA